MIYVHSNYFLIIHIFGGVLLLSTVLSPPVDRCQSGVTSLRGSTRCNSDALSVYSRNQAQTYSRRWSNVSQRTNPLAFMTDYAGRQLSLLTLTVTANVILPSQQTRSQSAVAGCHRGFWRDVCSSFKEQQTHDWPLLVRVINHSCPSRPVSPCLDTGCTKLQLDMWLKRLSGADVCEMYEGHLD